MLKLVFAFDHVHYAKYNTFRHVLLTTMQQNNEDAFTHLLKYEETSTGLPFSAIHGDLVTEHFNRETKGTAGPFRSGYSTDLHALNRWVKTSHIHIFTLREAMKKRFRLNHSSTHKELTCRNKKRQHGHVKKLKKHLVDYNVHSFGPGPVQNFANGKEIDINIIQELLDAGKTGDDKAYVNFANERPVEGKKTIFDTIRKCCIKTGIEMRKIKKTKEVSVLTEDKQAFGTIVAKATSLYEAFTYPITSIPLSTATPCGSIKAINHLLETNS